MQSLEGVIKFFGTLNPKSNLEIITVTFSLDNAIIEIPKGILCAASPVLAAIFTNNSTENATNSLCISQFTSSSFDRCLYRAILCHMGVKDYPCTSSEAIALLPLAHFYQQDELVKLLKSSIIQSPTVGGVVALTNVGIECSLSKDAIQKLCDSSFFLHYFGRNDTCVQIRINDRMRHELSQLPGWVLVNMIDYWFKAYSFKGLKF